MARGFPADTRMQRAMTELYEKETNAQLSWFVDKKQSAGEGEGGPAGHSHLFNAMKRRMNLQKLAVPEQTSPLSKENNNKDDEEATASQHVLTTTKTTRKKQQQQQKQEQLLKKLQEQLNLCGPTNHQQREGDAGAVSTAVQLSSMRPATPKTRRALYTGFSKEGKGRAHYLQLRKSVPPEWKFPFPVSSSMEYGWKLSPLDATTATSATTTTTTTDSEVDPAKQQLMNRRFGRTRIIQDTFFKRTGVPMQHQSDMLSRSGTAVLPV